MGVLRANVGGSWVDIPTVGPPGPAGPPGGGGTMEFTYNNGNEPPAVGQVRFNNASLPSATKMWLNYTTAPGTDVKTYLLYAAKTGTKIYLQDKDDSAKWVEYKLASDPTDKTTYGEWTVTYLGSGTALVSAQRVMATLATAGGGAATTVSDTAPSSPISGQLWFESDTGKTYIWYTDPNTSQWVQIAGISMVQPVQTAETYNRIVNPAMQVSQENGNTAGTAIAYYAADQWSFWQSGGGAYSFQRVQVTTPKGSRDRLRLTVTTADAVLDSTDLLQMFTYIEGVRIADLLWSAAQAKQIIIRFGFKAPAGTY